MFFLRSWFDVHTHIFRVFNNSKWTMRWQNVLNNSIENCKNAEIFKLKKKALVLFTHHSTPYHQTSPTIHLIGQLLRMIRRHTVIRRKKRLITNRVSVIKMYISLKPFVDRLSHMHTTFRIPFAQQPRVIYNLVRLKFGTKKNWRKKLLKNYRQKVKQKEEKKAAK